MVDEKSRGHILQIQRESGGGTSGPPSQEFLSLFSIVNFNNNYSLKTLARLALININREKCIK